ncbi:enoyl-CoA hydratase/isomerase family protein [Shewanella sp. 202IG2-18]|nr:enoyl-CoA hydratase/isomerase family protein [Parashewanella hymeniacidonis]
MEKLLMTCQQSVFFQTLATASGKLIGVATLNAEKALNALSLDMVRLLTEQLTKWKSDTNIAFVVLDGCGEKAFCAGGDVRALYDASIANKGQVAEAAKTFFTEEYQLDHLIHTFEKPVMVWGNGFVMGGGVGLMAGASHRVVTETSRIAMPEVTIGLFPDVGGSYFLNRTPGKSGMFLGFTAYQMNAADACYVGMANHYLNNDDKEPMFDVLATVDWSDDIGMNHQYLDEALHEVALKSAVPKGESVIADNQGLIDTLMSGNLNDIVTRMTALETDEKWLSRAKSSMLSGSPISCQLIFEQAKLGTDLSLADVFRWELAVSVNCLAIGDFNEGVRALLIDKDRNPKWHQNSVSEVPSDLIQKIITSPWKEHPLAAL